MFALSFHHRVELMESERELYHYDPYIKNVDQTINKKLYLSEPGKFEYHVSTYATSSRRRWPDIEDFYLKIQLTIFINGTEYHRFNASAYGVVYEWEH